MQKSRDSISSSLQKKGFRLKDRGDHFFFIYYNLDGKKSSVLTKISRGTQYRTLTDNLLAQMAKQCKLTKSDFIDLIDCPLSRDNYEKKLKEQALF